MITRFRSICCFAWACLLLINVTFAENRIAVMDFTFKGKGDDWSIGFADLIESHLDEIGFEIYDRRQIRYLLSERGLQKDGWVQVNSANIKKLKNVPFIVTGEIERASKKDMLLSVKLLNNISGRVAMQLELKGEYPNSISTFLNRVSNEIEKKTRFSPKPPTSQEIAGFPVVPEAAMYFYKGIQSYSEKDFESALQHFNRSLKVNYKYHIVRSWAIKCYSRLGLNISAGLYSDFLPKQNKNSNTLSRFSKETWSIYGLNHLSKAAQREFQKTILEQKSIEIFEDQSMSRILNERDLIKTGDVQDFNFKNQQWFQVDKFLVFNKNNQQISAQIIDSTSGILLHTYPLGDDLNKPELHRIKWKELKILRKRIPINLNSPTKILKDSEKHIEKAYRKRFLAYLNDDFTQQHSLSLYFKKSLIEKWHAINAIKKLPRHELVPILLQTYDGQPFTGNLKIFFTRGEFYKILKKELIQKNTTLINEEWILKNYPKHICSALIYYNRAVEQHLLNQHPQAVRLFKKADAIIGLNMNKKNQIRIPDAFTASFNFFYSKSLFQINDIDRAKERIGIAEKHTTKAFWPAITTMSRAYLSINSKQKKYLIKEIISFRDLRRSSNRKLKYAYLQTDDLSPEIKSFSKSLQSNSDKKLTAEEAFRKAKSDPHQAWEFLYQSLDAELHSPNYSFNRKIPPLLNHLLVSCEKANEQKFNTLVQKLLQKSKSEHHAEIHFQSGDFKKADELFKKIQFSNNIKQAKDAILRRAYIRYAFSGDNETNNFLWKSLRTYIDAHDKEKNRFDANCVELQLLCLRTFSNTGRLDLAQKLHRQFQKRYKRYLHNQRWNHKGPDYKKKTHFYKKGIPIDIWMGIEYEFALAHIGAKQYSIAIDILKNILKEIKDKSISYPFYSAVIGFDIQLLCIKKLEYLRLFSSIEDQVYGKIIKKEINDVVLNKKWALALHELSGINSRVQSFTYSWLKNRIKAESENIYRFSHSPPRFLRNTFYNTHDICSYLFQFHFTLSPNHQQSIFELINSYYYKYHIFTPNRSHYKKGYDRHIPSVILSLEIAQNPTVKSKLKALLNHGNVSSENTKKVLLKFLEHPSDKIKIRTGNHLIKSFRLKTDPLKNDDRLQARIAEIQINLKP